MLQLKLYPAEFRTLISYLRVTTQYQDQVPLRHQLVSKLVLVGYLARWTPVRYVAWRNKRADKSFSLRLPIIVGLSLYQDMLSGMLTGHQQGLLDKLDQAIVNYRPVHSDPEHIGNFLPI